MTAPVGPGARRYLFFHKPGRGRKPGASKTAVAKEDSERDSSATAAEVAATVAQGRLETVIASVSSSSDDQQQSSTALTTAVNDIGETKVVTSLTAQDHISSLQPISFHSTAANKSDVKKPYLQISRCDGKRTPSVDLLTDSSPTHPSSEMLRPGRRRHPADYMLPIVMNVLNANDSDFSHCIPSSSANDQNDSLLKAVGDEACEQQRQHDNRADATTDTDSLG
ncbi:unnamed protein product [Gongylonema pulchrum]|uniref:Uncharacterized protein n=1 Tax=Gongylonema pulchrum TaxID=637853 RepID=A0A183DNN2_9BILA|nr:unnamed protein product [Gongylonema pulchrum]